MHCDFQMFYSDSLLICNISVVYKVLFYGNDIESMV